MRRAVVISNILSFTSVFILHQEYVVLFALIYIPMFILLIKKKEYFILLSVLFVVTSFLIANKELNNYEELPNRLEIEGYLYHGVKSDEFVLKNGKYKILIKNDNMSVFSESFFSVDKYKLTYNKNDFFFRNPNTFNYKNYLHSNGFSDVVKLSEANLTKIKSKPTYNIKYFNYRNKKYLKDRINNLTNDDETSAFITAILFGDTDDISEETLKVFRKNGTAHVLAISGLHIGLMYAMIYASLFFVNSHKRNTISIIILFLYILFIGVKISALRAGVMLLFTLLASGYERKYDMLNTLSLISVVLIFFSPMIVFNISYQLSFVAVLVISTVYKELKSRIDMKKSLFWKLLLLPVAIQLGMVPIQVYYFNNISILSFLINIPTIMIMTIVLYLSVLLIISIMLLPLIAPFISDLIHLLVTLTKTINISYDTFDILSVEIPSPPISLVLFIYISFIFIIFKSRVKMISYSLAALFVCHLIVSMFSVDVYFYDIGQGDSALIHQSFGDKILIDGGPHSDDDYLKEILYKNGISGLDGIFISHAHSDHIGGVIDISDDIRIGSIFYKKPNQSDELFVKLIKKVNSNKFFALEKGNKLNIGNVTFETHGVSLGSNINNSSLVTTVKIYSTKLLFTGDIEEEAENKLLKEDTLYDVDILKIPHHGSKTSSTADFIKKIKPEIAIASLGKNYYGHPNNEVIKRYLDSDSEFYRTDKGCVKVTILPFNIYFVKQYD